MPLAQVGILEQRLESGQIESSKVRLDFDSLEKSEVWPFLAGSGGHKRYERILA